MIAPSYPDYPFRIRKDGDADTIFCELRRRWVRLTPEEWVRQNTFQWLKTVADYPGEMISIEKGIRVVDMARRYDLLVYDPDHRPWMLIECKAQSVRLGRETLMQVLRYNIALPVPYLLITNGDHIMLFRREDGLVAVDEMPAWGRGGEW
jgi:hypothetical protein